MKTFVTKDTPVTDEVLNVIAYLPTASLSKLVEDEFFKKMSDKDFMRLGVLLAAKGFEEGGSPIGGVIIDDRTRKILGKGHNTLVQENHPYNHGETSAVRDAGRRDFSLTTMFTTMSPCETCAAMIAMLQFQRLVIGDKTTFSGNEGMLRQRGIQVDILEDPDGLILGARYASERRNLCVEDIHGVAGVRQAAAAAKS
jgi:cytosine deaminase